MRSGVLIIGLPRQRTLGGVIGLVPDCVGDWAAPGPQCTITLYIDHMLDFRHNFLFADQPPKWQTTYPAASGAVYGLGMVRSADPACCQNMLQLFRPINHRA